MAFPWAGLFSAVSGIASLFGGKKKTENRVNYKQMVRDAEAAGFNPLTVLRNGGAAGYMQTAHPALSSGEVIGGALSQVGNFLADFDPYADQKKEQEARLVDAQIANLNASTATMFPPRPGKPGSFNVPSWGAANVEQRPSGRAGSLSKTAATTLPVASWLDPPKPTSEALPVWVPGVDRDGKQIWIPNPDGPDIEQLGFGLVTRSQSGYEAALNAALSGDYGTVRKQTPAEKQTSKEKRKDSWVPWWFPSFDVQWN